MSKFEELCEASISSRMKWSAYRDRSYANLDKLVVGFVKYCEIPQGCVSFRPINWKPEDTASYNLIRATEYKNGFWNLGLCITLSKLPSTAFPRPELLLAFCLKEESGRVVVKRYLEDKPRILDPNDEDQCKGFYESIVDEIKKLYLRIQPDSDNRPSSIGFGTEFDSAG